MERKIIITGAIFGMLAIILGAFGAHALKKVLDPDLFSSFDVAVRYQGFFSMGMLILALNSDRFAFSMNRILGGMMVGMLFFCFSIYLLILMNVMQWPKGILVAFTPIGGSITIISWLVFLYRLIKN